VKEVSPELLRRLVVADPRSHVALAAFQDSELVGEARYVCQGESAEFALAVADSWRRRGLARRLEGEVLASNEAMLEFVARTGFRLRPHEEDGRLVRAQIAVQPQPGSAENRGQGPISGG